MSAVKDYKELRVFRLAFESAMRIADLSRTFPREERYALTDQIRRSSRSVCANLAEAWRKRRYEAAFVSKLCDADAEAAETEVWLLFALRHGYIQGTDHARLSDDYDHICRQLAKIMEDAELWCGNGSRIRETEDDFFVEPESNAGERAHDAIAPVAPRPTLHAPRFP